VAVHESGYGDPHGLTAAFERRYEQ